MRIKEFAEIMFGVKLKDYQIDLINESNNKKIKVSKLKLNTKLNGYNANQMIIDEVE